MENTDFRSSRLTLHVSRLCVFICTLLTFALGPSAAYASHVLLPPPPPPPPQPATQASTGGFIELRVQFPSTWLWDEVHWQNLWTIVQWQDQAGRWHEVSGWQGQLNDVTVGTDGDVVGTAVWWVAKPDLGTGPFRWRVYQGRERRLLATSDPFDLPGTAGETITVRVSLNP